MGKRTEADMADEILENKTDKEVEEIVIHESEKSDILKDDKPLAERARIHILNRDNKKRDNKKDDDGKKDKKRFKYFNSQKEEMEAIAKSDAVKMLKFENTDNLEGDTLEYAKKRNYIRIGMIASFIIVVIISAIRNLA